MQLFSTPTAVIETPNRKPLVAMVILLGSFIFLREAPSHGYHVAVARFLFCTAMLPVTNYRFRGLVVSRLRTPELQPT